jgi:Ca-activated chloride channel family protein
VLDGSQSMITRWESGTKMSVAQKLLADMVDSLKYLENVEMALRVYGHQKPVPPQDCDDTKLEVPFSPNNAHAIKNKLNSIRPRGTTPIAHSLELSADDFPECTDCRNIIILITDGIESCEGDPCAVSQRLQKAGIVLKPFVIGIGIFEDYKEAFECIGRYYDAANEDRFKEVLDVVVSQALNTTTVQINLLDTYLRPTESNVNMTFYDSFSGERLHNFMHTINYKGNPDTLRLDPIPTYKIQVHTLPPVIKDSILITPGTHNTIAIQTPQGSLMVKTQNAPQYRDLQFIVRQQGHSETLNLQTVDVAEKYLTGTYEVEILCIPRMWIKDIKINQSKTSYILIPQPGLITFASSAPGYGALYKEDGNQLIWVCNLNSELLQQTLPIQPGNYRVITRSKNAKESVFTSNIFFQVKSGEGQKITLY